MFSPLRELVRLPAAAAAAWMGAVGQALRGVRRAAGRSVDGVVSRAVHGLSRAADYEVDPMTDLHSAEPPPTACPGEGPEASPAMGPGPGTPGEATAARLFDPPAGLSADEAAATGRAGVLTKLEKAAVFLMFSGAEPATPDAPVFTPEGQGVLAGFDLLRDLRRLDVDMRTPGPATAVWAQNHTGQAVGRLRARFRVAPDDFDPTPGREPPPTALDPSRPQRFVLLDGGVDFGDRPQSGVSGHGVGRTIPATEGGRPVLRLGAVVRLLDGRGRLKGLGGLGVVAGVLAPPDRIQGVVVLRILDPAGAVTAATALNPVQWVPDPDPLMALLTLRGEADPDNPRMPISAPGGGVRGAHMSELLRLARTGFDLAPDRKGVRARTTVGPVVARLTHTTLFRASATGEASFEMKDVVFTFINGQGADVGTLRVGSVAGAVEVGGLPGVAAPVIQVAGFGPLDGGTGPFLGAEGLVTVNVALTLYPNAFSSLYVLRLLDPAERLRGGWQASH
jgi:hypothetical protein